MVRIFYSVLASIYDLYIARSSSVAQCVYFKYIFYFLTSAFKMKARQSMPRRGPVWQNCQLHSFSFLKSNLHQPTLPCFKIFLFCVVLHRSPQKRPTHTNSHMHIAHSQSPRRNIPVSIVSFRVYDFFVCQ